jgi:2-keto-4-pentenoate hydratase/2-oxohepta-3-ene-1,7-dioic acid hydratase in catechol pathway
MKIASYSARGAEGFGIVRPDGGVVDLARRGVAASLRGFLSGRSLDELRRFVDEAPDWHLDQVILLTVVPDASKIICVGINYRAHALEASREVGGEPVLFLRTGQSLVGSGSSIVKPRVSDQFDYEGELAVVIGRRGRHIAASQASGYIAGYCCFNDGSVRDYQKQSVPVGKNFDKSGACGPWLVTPDEAGSGPFDLVTRVNGEERQRVTTDHMIFPLGQIISYASRFTELLPGDIIATGTPAGVGSRRTPPNWLKAGDEVEIELSRIGILKNRVVQEE